MNPPQTMPETRIFRERLIWTATVAVLVTTTAWLAVLVVALFAGAFDGSLAQLAIVGRVLLGAIVSFRQELLAVTAAAVAVAMLVGAALPRAASRVERQGAHHA